MQANGEDRDNTPEIKRQDKMKQKIRANIMAMTKMTMKTRKARDKTEAKK